MGGESGKRSEGRRSHSHGALSMGTEPAHRSQPPSGAKADGRGYGIGSKPGTVHDARSWRTRLPNSIAPGIAPERRMG
jgi:hypothetical protein